MYILHILLDAHIFCGLCRDGSSEPLHEMRTTVTRSPTTVSSNLKIRYNVSLKQHKIDHLTSPEDTKPLRLA